MEINNTCSESPDNNDVLSQIQKPSEQSISTPPLSKKKYDVMKYPTFQVKLILFLSFFLYGTRHYLYK